MGISTPFEALSPSRGQVVYALLTRPPLYSASEETFLVRLACLIHAANVRSEPGSNPSLGFIIVLDFRGQAHTHVLGNSCDRCGLPSRRQRHNAARMDCAEPSPSTALRRVLCGQSSKPQSSGLQPRGLPTGGLQTPTSRTRRNPNCQRARIRPFRRQGPKTAVYGATSLDPQGYTRNLAL